MDRFAACTVVAKSCLSFARVLARSFHRHHPDVPFFVLLADQVDGQFDPRAEPFSLIELADLELPRPERLRFHYAQQPLSYACTPWLLSHLLRQGFTRVVFFKQETLILDDVGSLFGRLETASIVITPHLLAPPESEAVARELNILLSGTFNVGLLGVARTSEAYRFLSWWQDRVYAHCLHDVASGMHFEQRWLDLAPAYFDAIHVLRDAAYNVGHWNLPERRVEVTASGDVLVDGTPCRVFRFSGYRPDHPTAVTQYNERLSWDTVGASRAVFERFRQALLQEGYERTSRWPYAFAAFDNGVPIPAVARLLYMGMGDEVERFGDPRVTAPANSYWRWMTAPAAEAAPDCRVSRLWHAIYRSRPDLQQAFPHALGDDRDAFMRWARQCGIHEHGVSELLLGLGRS